MPAASTESISLQMPESLAASSTKLHLLPAHFAESRPAAVSTFFRPKELEKEVIYLFLLFVYLTCFVVHFHLHHLFIICS